MSKTLKYSSFVIACVLVIVAFVTAKTYTQLGAAVLLYPLAVYFAYKLFLHEEHKVPEISIRIPDKSGECTVPETVVPKREQVDVADVDKRTFLKFIGAAGVSFFLFSLLGRRVDTLLFGRSFDPAFNNFGNNIKDEVSMAEASPTGGYLISEIDDGVISYYGFTNRNGAWFIMKEDPNNGSFRYIKGNSDFSNSWTNRTSLNYDYYYNVFID